MCYIELNGIVNDLVKHGELTDDLSLLRIEYKGHVEIVEDEVVPDKVMYDYGLYVKGVDYSSVDYKLGYVGYGVVDESVILGRALSCMCFWIYMCGKYKSVLDRKKGVLSIFKESLAKYDMVVDDESYINDVVCVKGVVDSVSNLLQVDVDNINDDSLEVLEDALLKLGEIRERKGEDFEKVLNGKLNHLGYESLSALECEIWSVKGKVYKELGDEDLSVLSLRKSAEVLRRSGKDVEDVNKYLLNLQKSVGVSGGSIKSEKDLFVLRVLGMLQKDYDVLVDYLKSVIVRYLNYYMGFRMGDVEVMNVAAHIDAVSSSDSLDVFSLDVDSGFDMEDEEQNLFRSIQSGVERDEDGGSTALNTGISVEFAGGKKSDSVGRADNLKNINKAFFGNVVKAGTSDFSEFDDFKCFFVDNLLEYSKMTVSDLLEYFLNVLNLFVYDNFSGSEIFNKSKDRFDVDRRFFSVDLLDRDASERQVDRLLGAGDFFVYVDIFRDLDFGSSKGGSPRMEVKKFLSDHLVFGSDREVVFGILSKLGSVSSVILENLDFDDESLDVFYGGESIFGYNSVDWGSFVDSVRDMIMDDCVFSRLYEYCSSFRGNFGPMFLDRVVGDRREWGLRFDSLFKVLNVDFIGFVNVVEGYIDNLDLGRYLTDSFISGIFDRYSSNYGSGGLSFDKLLQYLFECLVSSTGLSGGKFFNGLRFSLDNLFEVKSVVLDSVESFCWSGVGSLGLFNVRSKVIDYLNKGTLWKGVIDSGVVVEERVWDDVNKLGSDVGKLYKFGGPYVRDVFGCLLRNRFRCGEEVLFCSCCGCYGGCYGIDSGVGKRFYFCGCMSVVVVEVVLVKMYSGYSSG